MTNVAHPATAGILGAARMPCGNFLLAALPQADMQRIAGALEYATWPRGLVLAEPDSRVRHVYFPVTAVVSQLYVTREGATGEVAIGGNDGLIGMPALTGTDIARHRAVVQFGGCGYRLRADLAKREFARGEALHSLALRYLHVLLSQISQTAICNRHHRLEHQLCRWLLLILDRLPTHWLPITQEVIANMLGVRREGISEAASRLKAQGLIAYSRGRIEVLDRAGLEHMACECYAVVKNESDRLFPHSALHAREANAAGGFTLGGVPVGTWTA